MEAIGDKRVWKANLKATKKAYFNYKEIDEDGERDLEQHVKAMTFEKVKLNQRKKK